MVNTQQVAKLNIFYELTAELSTFLNSTANILWAVLLGDRLKHQATLPMNVLSTFNTFFLLPDGTQWNFNF